MDNTADLRLLLASRHPLIVAETRDERRLMDILTRAAGALGLPVWVWSATGGLARAGRSPQYGTADPSGALAFIADVGPGVFVFADVHRALQDPVLVRRIKEFAQSPRAGQTLVLTSPVRALPPELDGLALPWTLRPPSREELQELVTRTIGDLTDRGFPVSLDRVGIASLVDALRGLSVAEAERLIQRATLEDGALGTDDVTSVRRSKAELLEAGGAVELVESADGTLDRVGGMDRLKEWLRLRARAMEPAAREFGLEPPRGILLTGVPGCGKSLVAKTLARTWGLPLLLLDPGTLFGPYLGESEQRLRDALATVEAMAPAVVWVDEIEKGFSTGGRGDGGASARILGTFLRWMQERPEGAFLVATCNDVEALPPELLRKGRFDEVFFVDLPGPAERAEILRVHLSSRGRDPVKFDLDRLVEESEGYSGAEIEAAVVGALYRAYARGTDLTIDDVLEELAATVPLSRARPDDIERLRAWAEGRAVMA